MGMFPTDLQQLVQTDSLSTLSNKTKAKGFSTNKTCPIEISLLATTWRPFSSLYMRSKAAEALENSGFSPNASSGNCESWYNSISFSFIFKASNDKLSICLSMLSKIIWIN